LFLQRIHLHVLVPVICDDDDDVVGEEEEVTRKTTRATTTTTTIRNSSRLKYLTNCNESCRDLWISRVIVNISVV
jgi:hypothetical protein